MADHLVPSTDVQWKGFEKILFRFAFIYFILLTIPLDWNYFKLVFSIRWLSLTYADIFDLAHYQPLFFYDQPSFLIWIWTAIVSVLGSLVWTFFDKSSLDYDILYYWLRALLRYRLSIALFVYGFIKVFPLQSPYPSISNLNTHYGDFNEWKIFSLSLGIVPSFEFFLGLVEISAAALLLYRRTATIGALIALIFLGNVFFSNLAYGGGEFVFSFYLVSLAAFILLFDAKRLLSLWSFNLPTQPNTFHPVFNRSWIKYGRKTIQIFTLFIVMLYGFQTLHAYRKDKYKYPSTLGLKEAAGIYNVSQFIFNGDTLTYSKTDSLRWQDVVFEKWATISIRTYKLPTVLETNSVEKITLREEDRKYELEGSGGRWYYSYEIDSLTNTLNLKNKNGHYSGDKWILKYKRPSKSQIVLSGANQRNDSITVVLDKINKKYLLEEVAKQGRQKPIKL